MVTMHATEQPDLTRLTYAVVEPIAVTQTLNGLNGLDPSVRLLLEEADEDIRAHRFESALDIGLLVSALEPNYLPNYIRSAELLVLTDRLQEARRLTDTIRKLTNVNGGNQYELHLTRVETHLNPSADTLLKFAYYLLESGQHSLLGPYAAAAIDASIAESRHLQERARAALGKRRKRQSQRSLVPGARAVARRWSRISA
jgi:hypothetical protein